VSSSIERGFKGSRIQGFEWKALRTAEGPSSPAKLEKNQKKKSLQRKGISTTLRGMG
jgi:hypothetical protein